MVATGKLSSKVWFRISLIALPSLSAFLMLPSLKAQKARFHDAPASAAESKNPYAGQRPAIQAGAKLYAANCAACHGQNGQGTGNIPALAGGPAEVANEGELFWFITNGDLNNGMPSWKQLPEQERWQLVTFVTLGSWLSVPAAANSASAAPAPSAIGAPPPQPPFTDFRYEKPATFARLRCRTCPPLMHRSLLQIARRSLRVPPMCGRKAPAGFKVDLYATGLDNPRTIRTAPNGDFFVAESEAGEIKIFRGITADGKPQQVQAFATGLKRPLWDCILSAG